MKISAFALISAYCAGPLLGAFALLSLKYMGVNVRVLEERLEKFRQWLDQADVPLRARVVRISAILLRVVYGEDVGLRFLRSIGIAFLLVLCVTAGSCSIYRGSRDSIRPSLRTFEMSVAPAAVRECIRSQKACDDAFEEYPCDPRNSMCAVMDLHVHTGEPYASIRSGQRALSSRLPRWVSEHVRSTEMLTLLLFEGTTIKPGLHWPHLAFLWIFGFLIDFTSASLAWRLGREDGPSTSLSVLWRLAVALCGSGVLYLFSLFVFGKFFGGNVEVFFLFVIGVPLILLFVVGGLGATLYYIAIAWQAFRALEHEAWQVVVGAFLGLAFGIASTTAGASMLLDSDMPWRIGPNLPSIARSPIAYWASFGSAIPLLLVVVAVGIGGAVRFVADPARRVLWAYLTFAKTHQGSTLVAALVALLAPFVMTLLEIAYGYLVHFRLPR